MTTRRDIGVQRMGKLLLQGWVMTDSECPNKDCGMITFRKKDSSIVGHCCLCNDQNDPLPVISSSIGDEISEPIIEEIDDLKDLYEELEQEQDLSKLMGQKLLQGCTMMAEPCSKCKRVPLMRDRKMTLFCVGCDTDISVKETIKEETTVQSIKESSSLETLNTARATAKSANSINSQLDLQSLTSNLAEKLEYLNTRLIRATSYQDIQSITSAISSTLGALKATRDFQ